MRVIPDIFGIVICKPQETTESRDRPGDLEVLNTEQLARRWLALATTEHMPTELHSGCKENRLSEIGNQLVPCQHGKHSPNVDFVLVDQFLISHTGQPHRTDEDIVKVRVSHVGDLLEDPVHHSLKNRGAIFYSLRHYFPHHEPKGRRHPCERLAALCHRDLVEGILQVNDAEEMPATLADQDVCDPRQRITVIHRTP